MDLLAKIVCSKVRAEIFRILFGVNEPELHLRDIHRRTGLAINGIQRDLAKLIKLDLITSERDGNRLYFKANKAHPLYRDLHNIVLKTSGLVEVLKEALKNVKKDDLFCAFVFGSIARQEERAASDLDLMIIGNLGPRKLSELLSEPGKKIERVINPYSLTLEEFKKKRDAGDHFITRVLESKKLFVIGSEDDLRTNA